MSSNAQINAGGSGGGISFVGLLQIVLITLKLLGKINWGWKWVLAPTWIPFCLVVIVIVALTIAHAIRKD